MRRYIILYCAVCARATCNASNVLPDEGIAEALAQTCLHDNWTGNFLRAAEKDSKSRNWTNSKTIPELLDEIRANKKLSTAAEWSDGNKVRDGIIARASDEMLKYTSQWTVTPENLEQKTAEMINSCIYYTAAAQHPPKQVSYILPSNPNYLH
jgi:hypothetical protein